MGTFIRIDSICIDLIDCMDCADPGPCEHFSLRGYVSEMRKKDWKKCWPFPINDSEEQPSLPPLDVPKFRWWACESCRQATAAEGTDKDDRTDHNCSNNECGSASNCGNAVISSGIQQAPMLDCIPERREIDLNIPIDLSSDSDCEIENNVEVQLSRIADPAIGLESNINNQVSSVGLPEVCPGIVQEVKRDQQCQEELRESCAMLREGTTVTQQDNVTEHPTGQLPAESVACSDAVPTGNTDKIVNNDCQDQQPEKSTGLSRKRPRKMRLLTDLLSENGDPKIDQMAKNGSASHLPSNASTAVQTLSILPGKVDVQGDMTLTKKDQGKKRKLLPDEESKRPADTCYQRIENEVQNLEGGAKTIDFVSDNRSKDVLMSKKIRKIQHGDNHLISEPCQNQHRENGDTLNIANKECASKTVSSGFFSHASTDKGMDDPLHSLRTENVRNFSKGKGKMVQADEGLDSLSCWKNDRLVEDSFAHKGANNMSNVPVSVPILSAQGAPNGEGLHLSLNCYSSAEVCNEHQTEIRLPSSLPLLEVTSKPQLIRKDSSTNISSASRHITTAHSGKGKGVLREEIDGTRKKDKTAEVIEGGGTKTFYDLTVEDSDQGTSDDVPMKGVEILTMNQYERSLSDMENISNLMEKSTQKGNQHAGDKKNGTITIQENVLPRKGNSISYFHPFAGNPLGVNNLFKTQPPFGFEALQSKNKPSSGVYFPPMDTIKLGPVGSSKFNRSIAESGSSGASLQAKGVFNLRNAILHQDGEASHPWPTLANSNASRYDVVPRKAVSQPSGSITGMISLQSGSLYEQTKNKNIDLNNPNFSADNLQNLGRNIGHGIITRTNAEYRFPAKHNAMEAHQNPRGSFDTHPNETIHALHLLGLMDAGRQSATSLNAGVRAQMLKRPSHPGECSTKLEIGKSKTQGSQKRQASDISRESDGNLTNSAKRDKSSSSNSAMQTGVHKQLTWHNIERETPGPSNSISENLCVLNRNPGDFSVPSEGSVHMINGEDLIFEDNVPEERFSLPAPRGSKSKRKGRK